jgi:hypothetical protein
VDDLEDDSTPDVDDVATSLPDEENQDIEKPDVDTQDEE